MKKSMIHIKNIFTCNQTKIYTRLTVKKKKKIEMFQFTKVKLLIKFELELTL